MTRLLSFLFLYFSISSLVYGVSPSDVYHRTAQLDELLSQALIQQKQQIEEIKLSLPPAQLGPFHVYQLAVLNASRLRDFATKQQLLVLPTIVTSPRKYGPQDVKFLTDLMLQNLMNYLSNNTLFLSEYHEYKNKTPGDVFQLQVRVFTKLNQLIGIKKISPNEVFSEVIKATEDVRSLLVTIDPFRHYRIDYQPSQDKKIPKDVFNTLRSVRKNIRKVALAVKVELPVIGSFPKGKIIPGQVLLETQLIIAELNLLKIKMKTAQATPLTIPVKNKNPTLVNNEALLLNKLLNELFVLITAKTQ